MPFVRSSLVVANQRSKWRRSGPPDSAVIWWTMASGCAVATASPTAAASSPSTITACAPSASSSRILASLRVVAVTW